MSNPIKNFFKKKKIDAKFKMAGTGRRLNDDSGPSASSSAGNRPSEHDSYRPANPSAAAIAAREAALRRTEQQLSKQAPRTPLDRLLEEERKKTLHEMKEREELKARMAKTEKPVNQIDLNQKFYCPTLGIEDSFAHEDLSIIIEEKIRSDYSADPVLMGSLLIVNCNALERSQQCIATLKLVLNNLKTDYEELLEKYRKVRKSKIQGKILSAKGSAEFLSGIGFVLSPDDEWYIFENLSNRNQIDYYLDVLESTKKAEVRLDRQLTYRDDNDPHSEMNTLNDDFFNLTVDDLSRRQQELTQEREMQQTLMTREMRERLRSNNKVDTKYTRIRCKLPDGLFIEATFFVTETPFDLLNVLCENVEFENVDALKLLVGCDVIPKESYSATFKELDLYPTVLLKLQ